jgi:hypothetical protein
LLAKFRENAAQRFTSLLVQRIEHNLGSLESLQHLTISDFLDQLLLI